MDELKPRKLKKKNWAGKIFEVNQPDGYTTLVYLEWNYHILCSMHGKEDCQHARAVVKKFRLDKGLDY